jgi:hypothetical protein
VTKFDFIGSFPGDGFEIRIPPASPGPEAITMTDGASHYAAVEFARTRLNFAPDPRQAEVLASSAKRGILNCTRQWGKSTVTAIKALHHACSVSKSLVIVSTPSERQSGEFIRKTAELIRQLNIRPRGDGKNAASLLLPNGSRIIGLPGIEATTRGFSAVSLLLFDEAAWVPEEVYKALRPMLAVSNGALWMLSTPNGKQGFFYENWENGGEEWQRFAVPATECPRIPKEFLEEERRHLGETSFRQEYLCAFTDSEDQRFGHDTVIRALVDVEPLGL